MSLPGLSFEERTLAVKVVGLTTVALTFHCQRYLVAVEVIDLSHLVKKSDKER